MGSIAATRQAPAPLRGLRSLPMPSRPSHDFLMPLYLDVLCEIDQ